MKKQIFLRGLFGFPIGITIGYVITIIISLSLGQGTYSPVVPSLVESAGSEIGAVLLQACLSGILGASLAAASVIWEIEEWSIAKQSGIYFLISSITMMPVAYFAKWMHPSLAGFISYFAVFVVIFLIIWVLQYSIWKSKINKINLQIRNNQQGETK